MSRWDALALGGGVIGAMLWYGWSAMDVKDTVTPKYIMLMPVLIVVFRKPIDALLRPLQVIKSKIPRLILIAIGLATPYFMAHYFYRNGTSNFPLAQKSIIWGTIVSYAILRIPSARMPLPPRLPSAVMSSWLFWFGLLLAIQWVLPELMFADDFTRDFRRLEDGLRTPGWAQGIAGTAATAINVLVNGALVFQSSPPPSAIPPDAGQQEEPTRYTMDIRTEDERTSLVAGSPDRLWIYAQILCSKPAIDARGLTNAIQFSFQGPYANWMSIKQQQFVGNYKSVLLAAEPPTPETQLGDNAEVTVQVSGRTAQGEPMEGPVKIELQKFKLEFF
ncbi:MAG TPA: hypothetical protein VJ719_03670 [Chthoniobacterales bacterium]|nr:hypothetical protein [Chthoniobacterales bacterium]